MLGGLINSAQQKRGLPDWKLLRTAVVDDDLDWLGELIDPDTFVATVGGTTADGTYALIFDVEGVGVFRAEFEREDSETDGEIAAELALASVAELPADVLKEADDDSGDVVGTFKGNVPKITITTEAPSGASITLAPGNVFPLTAQVPYAAIRDLGVPTTVRAVVIMVEDSEVIAHEGTVQVTPIDMLPHPTGDVPLGGETITAKVGIPFDLWLNGSSRWTLRIANESLGSATPDVFEIWYRILRE